MGRKIKSATSDCIPVIKNRILKSGARVSNFNVFFFEIRSE